MAVTEQGIYYQDNYSSVADVPEDMKKMAESVDKELEKDRDRLSKNEKDIKNIQDKNATQDEVIANINERDASQDENIEELHNKIAELEDKVVDLNNNQLYGQASGEYVHLSDSAKMECGIAVLGNSRQETREGYNLLNWGSFEPVTENGVTRTFIDTNIINFKGTPTQEGKIFGRAMLAYNLDENTEYVFSAFGIDTNKTNINIGNVGNVYQESVHFNTGNIVEPNGRYFGIMAKTTEAIDMTIKFQLSKGTEIKPYEPYGAMPSINYPSEIKSAGDNGCINEVISNENIALKDLNTTTSSTSTFIYIDKIAKVKKGKRYYVSLSGDEVFGNISGNNMHFRYQSDTNDNLYGWVQGINFSKGKYIECEYDAFIGIRVSGHLKYSDLMVSLEEITDYIPHQEQNYSIPTQQPMRAIGDIRDTFIKKDGKRYERHNIARKIFDGTENLIYTANTGNRYAYSITLNGKIKGQHSKEYLSNMYKQKPEGSWTSDGIISVSATSYNTYIFITGLATTSDVKAWLKELYDAGTPLCIDYILETPLDIECTPEQNEILDKLEKAKTYKNITNIFSTDEVSAIIDVDYKRDLETILNNMQQAILSQGGNV